MQEIPALITDLTIILVVAALTTLLCKKINLPSVLGYILAGFLAGPVVQFLPTIEDLGSIEVWSDIGVIFLMFGLGLEFSVHKRSACPASSRRASRPWAWGPWACWWAWRWAGGR